MLIVPRKLLERAISHARRTYPDECCGILAGRQDGDKRWVVSTRAVHNQAGGSARHRYAINPLHYIRIEKSLQALGQVVVGFYHSHPEHDPYPSVFDLEAAWPVDSLSYLIIGLRKEGPAEWKSWVWNPDGPRLSEEPVEVT